jgi:anti-anti-sigma factor
VARSRYADLPLRSQHVRNHEKGLGELGAVMYKPTVISISVVGEIAYLTIRGRVVAGAEVAALRESIMRAGPCFALLVVNLREVEKIDPAGLAALVFAYSTAQSLGARFRLAEVRPEVRKILAVAQLDTFFSIAESVPMRPTAWPAVRRPTDTYVAADSERFFDTGE